MASIIFHDLTSDNVSKLLSVETTAESVPQCNDVPSTQRDGAELDGGAVGSEKRERRQSQKKRVTPSQSLLKATARRPQFMGGGRLSP